MSLVSSKAIQNEDSQLLQKVELPVLEAPVVYERDDFSLASGLHYSASSCDTQPDIKIDDNDVASDGLSIMAREVHSDDTIIDVKGQRSNIFHSVRLSSSLFSIPPSVHSPSSPP